MAHSLPVGHTLKSGLRALSAALLLTLAAGCGQKGPLYLPTAEPAAEQQPAADGDGESGEEDEPA